MDAEKLQQIEVVINSCLERTSQLERSMIDVAKECGDAQIQAHDELGHGEFEKWRDATFGAKRRSTLAKYKRIAEKWTTVQKLIDADPDITVTKIDKALSAANKAAKGNSDKTPRAYLERLSRSVWDNPKYDDAEKARRQLVVHDWVGLVREGYRRRKPVGCVASHFLDSGSFSLKNVAVKHQLHHGGSLEDYYSSPDFHEYRDEYAYFVKRFHKAIDFYANLDVIGNSELTWKNQQYLEQVHHCKPIPVVHYGADTDLKWLHHYIDRGYDYIGLGGLATHTRHRVCREWIDKCFAVAEARSTPEFQIKFHGFGVGTQACMGMFKWHSVDSAIWMFAAKQGNIYVPPYEDGEFRFDKPPRSIHLTDMVEPVTEEEEQTWEQTEEPTPDNVAQLDAERRNDMRRWLRVIGVPFGKGDEANIKRKGVSNFHEPRRIANQIYLQRVADHYGIRIYFSGDATRRAEPEVVFGDEANIMMTFYKLRYNAKKERPAARFRRVLSARKRGPTVIEPRKRYVGIATCGKSKLDHEAKARDIYTGPYTKAGIEWMDRNCEDWVIVSALHHVLDPDEYLEPYNKCLRDMSAKEKKEWGAVVTEQLREKFPGREFICANRAYSKWFTFRSDELFEVFGSFRQFGQIHQSNWLKSNPMLNKQMIEKARLGQP